MSTANEVKKYKRVGDWSAEVLELRKRTGELEDQLRRR